MHRRGSCFRGRTDAAAVTAWPLRGTDIDQLGHVNNAAYWIAVEERFDLTTAHRAVLEYRHPLDLEDKVDLLQSNDELWFVVGSELRAAVALTRG